MTRGWLGEPAVLPERLLKTFREVYELPGNHHSSPGAVMETPPLSLSPS